MTALLWLGLVWVCGVGLRRWLLPDYAYLMGRVGEYRESELDFPQFFFGLSAALLLGLIPLTTLLYFFAVLCRLFAWQLRGSSLLAANLIFCPALFGGAWLALRRRGRNVWPQSCEGEHRLARRPLKERLRSALPWLAALIFMGFLTHSFFYSVFSMKGSSILSSATVTSDYAAHLATISSFVRGENFAPSTYPFFAGDGMRYHFFFFFLSANLHALGLSLPAALNLASAIGLFCFSSLMGLLAIRFSGRRAAFFWIQPLLYWQSSFSAFVFLREQWGRAQNEGRSFIELIASNQAFIGRLPNDNWGLWCVNVYANQRHLLFGLAAALLVLICVFPSLEARPRDAGDKTRAEAGANAGAGARPLGEVWREQWLTKDAWLSAESKSLRPFGAAALLLLCLPYWHGAVSVALLLMLFVCALPARNKLLFLLLGLLAVAAALAYSAYFSAAGPSVVSPRWQWGFISPDRSLKGVLLYALELLGLALPALLILPFCQKDRLRRTLAFAFWTPLIFAFTVSLTPDITVNHKYIIFARLLVCLPLVALLGRLWRPKAKALGRRALSRGLALLLGLLLVVSGLFDHLAYGRANRHPFALKTDGPFMRWLEQETEPRAVFLTPTWFFHPFFYSGRQAWFGYPYYAWSAGHDSFRREAEAKILWSGGGGQSERFEALVSRYDLKYALIDDELRRVEAGNLDEGFFDQHFPLVGSYPEMGHLKVYALR